MTGESKWNTNVEDQIKYAKEMIKNTKGLFLVRGGRNFYHYDKTKSCLNCNYWARLDDKYCKNCRDLKQKGEI